MLELYSHIFEAVDDLLTQSSKYHFPDIHPPQGLRLLLMRSLGGLLGCKPPEAGLSGSSDVIYSH